MQRKLYVLLGEVEEDSTVVASQELLDRLEEALGRMNDQFSDCMFTPITRTSGFPEFIGVLTTHKPIYVLARTLAEACYPLNVHLALGKGEVHTLETEDPEAMDGPAYDLAGELLYRARRDGRLLFVDTSEPQFDDLFNALMLLVQRTFQQWTERQWQVVGLYREHGRQSEVAERLQVSQQSVSSTLAGAGWRVLAEVEDNLSKVLSDPLSELLGKPQ
ncbi:MAG: hypothetical protein HKN21_10200 [Candidatus Eisenbacteria bacterium]|uniref:SatD family (SatD) n=1 Tax=Eiseniibacteriota bacterium TaxID=2212470 RepID=A0A7Y2E9M3_UNCEI|nr:hypothetical protein [Candidatus Eisenbacteria bacterium]